MRLSIRNQLKGKVQSIKPGAVMSIVKVVLKGGQTVTSSITREAVEDLKLASGSPVVVLVKSTEVMLGVENEASEKKRKKKKSKSRKR
jgi:molybdate transport system regulatory protein